MPEINQLYIDLLQFEKTALGKSVEKLFQEDRQLKIDKLIQLGCNSTDKDVARMAWALTFDSGIKAHFDTIRMGVEGPQSSEDDVVRYE